MGGVPQLESRRMSYGIGAVGFGPPSALAAYKLFLKNGEQQLAKFREQSYVQDAIDYFKRKVADVKSVDDFIKDDKLVQFTLKAFNLDGETLYMGRARKVLQESVDDPDAIVNRLVDPRYKIMTQAFDFATLGVSKLQQSSFIEDVVNKFVLHQFQQTAGLQNSAVTTALQFREQASGITSALDILGNTTARQVVSTVLGWPVQTVNQSIERQQALIQERIDVKGFQLTAKATAVKSAAEIRQLDVYNLNGAIEIANSTKKVVSALRDQINALLGTYQAQQSRQASPDAALAAEMPTQATAIPGLRDLRGLLGAAQGALGQVHSGIDKLDDLIDDAANPVADLATAKADFQALYTQIRGQITAAGFGDYYDKGSLLGASGAPAAPSPVTVNTAGRQVTIRSHDLAGVVAALDQANSLMQSATDQASVDVVRSQITQTLSTLGTAETQVGYDIGYVDAGVTAVPFWNVSLDTAQLHQGQETLSRATSTLTQVRGLLNQIQAVAQQSANLDVGADRSALNTQYQTLRQQIVDKIGTAAYNGENLLDAAAFGDTYSYTFLGAESVRTTRSDLLATITAALGADISSQANANAVLTAARGTITDKIDQTQASLKTDTATVELLADRLDPRGKVDASFRYLVKNLNDTITNANFNGGDFKNVNLLERWSVDLKITDNGTGGMVKLSAAADFRVLVENVLKAGRDALPGGTSFDSANPGYQALIQANIAAGQIEAALNQNSLILAGQRDQIWAAGRADREAPAIQIPDASEYTDRIVERYLTMIDAQQNNASSNSYLTGLLRPISLGYSIKA